MALSSPKAPSAPRPLPPPLPLDADAIARKRQKKQAARVGRAALRLDGGVSTGGSGTGLSLQ